VEKAAEALGGIAGAVSEMNSMITQIATAAEQQSSTAETINGNLMQISGIADKTAAGARQTDSSVQQLQELANELDTLTRTFRV
jgi:methyl-accepting chemotaxis protein